MDAPVRSRYEKAGAEMKTGALGAPVNVFEREAG